MASSLISSIMQLLTPDMVGRIASSLGLDRGLVQKAIDAGVPALLAAITGVASKPAGAQQLSSALKQQPPDMLSNLAGAIGNTGQRASADGGSGLLSGLLGGGAMNALTSAISNFTGMSQGTSKSLLGLLGPVVLGSLGQVQRSKGLDANGLANLLTSQKDQIAAAMPSGFARELSGSGLLDSLGDTWRGGAEAVSTAARRFGDASRDTAAGANQAAYAAASESASSASRWPLWILGLAVLAGVLWYLFGGQVGEQVAERTGTTADQAASSLVVDNVDLSNQVNSSVQDLTETLQGINDPASAQAALPKLQETTDELDRVSSLAAQLPPEGKRALAALITSVKPTVDQLCNKVLETPAVAGVAKPAIDTIRTKLDELARA